MGLRNFLIGVTIGVIGTLFFAYYEYLRNQLHFTMTWAIGSTFILYIVPPILFYSNCYIRRHLIFLPFAMRPFWVNFDQPETQGLKGTRNFYLTSELGIQIGVWHILPESQLAGSVSRDSSYWEDSLTNSGRPIILYLHGTSASRALGHRKDLYRLLQRLDYHVLTLDYRGYADSTRVAPFETGVVTDSTCLYKWIQGKLGPSRATIPLMVWGHSLGTGIGCHMVSRLCLANEGPTGLLLESPFSNLRDQFKYHWLSVIYRWIPEGLEHLAIRPLRKSDLAFDSDLHIANIDIPIIIMHAADDLVVPYFLGVKLYKAGVRRRPVTAAPIYFKHFSKEFGHRYICNSPELPDLIANFIKSAFSKDFNCESLRLQATEWNYKTKRRNPNRIVRSEGGFIPRATADVYY